MGAMQPPSTTGLGTSSPAGVGGIRPRTLCPMAPAFRRLRFCRHPAVAEGAIPSKPTSGPARDVGQGLRGSDLVVHLDEFARAHTRGKGFRHVVGNRWGYFVGAMLDQITRIHG